MATLLIFPSSPSPSTLNYLHPPLSSPTLRLNTYTLRLNTYTLRFLHTWLFKKGLRATPGLNKHNIWEPMRYGVG